MFTRRVTTALALVALAVMGACGGDDDGGDEAASGSDGGSSSDGGGGNGDMADAAVEYAECMREHGIDMPDPEVSDDGRVRVGGGPGGGGGMDPNSEEFAAAQEACQAILQEAGGGQGQADPERVAEMRDRAAALGDCMRSRGHEAFEDPQIDDNGGVRMTQTDPSMAEDPNFETDLSECEEEAGMGGIGGGG